MDLFPFTDSSQTIAQQCQEYNAYILKLHQSGNYLEARGAVEKMLEVSKQDKYLPGLVQAYINLGRIESYYQQFGDAITYFLEAKKVSDKTKLNQIKASAYENLGVCYAQSGNYSKGLSYILKSLEFVPNNARTISNAGNIYMGTGELDKALESFQLSLTINNSTSQSASLPFTLANIGEIYYRQKKYEQSQKKYEEALKIGLAEKSDRLICVANLGLGTIEIGRKNYEQALEFLDSALASARKHNINFLLEDCFLTYSQMYKEMEDYRQALHYKELFQQEREKLLESETKHKLQLLQERHSVTLDERAEREKKLESSYNRMEEKFRHMQSAYADVSGIGELGLFSDVMRDIVSIAEKFHEDRKVPVLIEGDTGTGKEIIARIIHHGKAKDASPFVVINCAAISPSLFESELFGYEDGAFTGSRKHGMAGKFEIAQGGTLFLDEIGELPLDMQPKLLRALQQKEIYRIGGSKPVKLDVRIICATNRDLKLEMEANRFRKDLFYRLNTGRIFIPPLTERKDEIAPLAQMFLLKFSREKKRDFQFINRDAIKLMEDYKWIGNVRELQNCIERVVLLYNDKALQQHHLNFLEFDEDVQHSHHEKYIHLNLPEEGLTLAEINKHVINKVLRIQQGNKTSAAKYLGVSRNTILNILKR